MKRLWCWRCKMDLPMLDEDEWRRVEPLLSADIKRIKAYRVEQRAAIEEALKNAHPAVELDLVVGVYLCSSLDLQQ